MTVYAVFKEAIYRHECGGIFSTLELAKAAADRFLSLGDGHHEWVVKPFELDVPTALAIEDPEWLKDGDNLLEPDDVYEAKKPRVDRWTHIKQPEDK